MLKTEPIGSIPRPKEVLEAIQAFEKGDLQQTDLNKIFDDAVKDTITKFEETGSPVISDGEQTKPSFATYPVHGLTNLAADGVVIPFDDGHSRQLPVLTASPFKYNTYAASYLTRAKQYATKPIKQAVIAASALSLFYPQNGIEGYPQSAFIDDLVNEAVADIRKSLDAGAHKVQIDFTEGRLAVKLDPSKGLLNSFIDLNNRVLSHFTPDERMRIGVHTCPGGDHDATHSADVDYKELLPLLFELNVGNIYMEFAGEKDKDHVLEVIKEYRKPDQTVFLGVIDVINEKVEDPKDVEALILHASEYIPKEYLGTTDDCGFSPFTDDISTSRETAFAKIKARVEGTKMASAKLG
jgi:methionine synthase II (cobalamin-independent)